MKQKNATRKIVITAMFVALTCVATMLIKVPTPMKGYVNLGDCLVLLCGWLLSPIYGFLAAGMGSALADLLSGYVMYVPATFIIKGLMALAAFYSAKGLEKKIGNLPSKIISAFFAELVMILGYLLFEGILYGFGAAALNISANGVQGIFGLILGCILVKVFEKYHISF